MRKSGRFLLKYMAAVGVMSGIMASGSVAFADTATSPVIVAGEKPGRTESNRNMDVSVPGDVRKIPEEENACAKPLADIEKLSGADQTDQYIVVLGSGMDSCKVEVGYYKKDADGIWQEQFQVPGFCGLNGMAADKQEGDKRTPTGVYRFTQNFGILADPGSILPYKQVDQYDFWVDDGNSRYYNQMVSTRKVEADWNSAEPLVAVDPAYHYALALNYNTDARTPGKGSAIFLHGLDPKKDWTSGCIAIPEEQVKLLVQEADADTRIAILPERPTAVME